MMHNDCIWKVAILLVIGICTTNINEWEMMHDLKMTQDDLQVTQETRRVMMLE